MVFGRTVRYTTLAVVLTAVVFLLAVPAWSQDEQSKDQGTQAKVRTVGEKTGKESAREESTTASRSENAGEAKTEKSSARQEDKTTKAERTEEAKTEKSSERNERSEKAASEKASKQANGGASGRGPLAGAKVEVQNDTGARGEVERDDVLIVRGNFKEPSANASITLRDKEGTRGTLDKDNAKITTTENGDLRIEVTGVPTGDIGDLRTEGLVVVESTGVERVGNSTNNGNNGNNNDGRGGQNDGFDCVQIVDTMGRERRDQRGFNQYNGESVQNCVLEITNNVDSFDDDNNNDDNNNDDNNNDDDNDNNGLNDDDFQRLLDEINDDDANITIQTSPDGQVLDTSAIDSLPNTGGLTLSGGALVAGLALFGVGAGMSLWRLGSGRSGG